MQSETNTTITGSMPGLCSILFLIFLVLKLTETGQVANWSWWWVTSPIWIPISFAILLFLMLVYAEHRKSYK